MTPVELLRLILTVLSWLVIIRALLSWFRPNPENHAVQLLHTITEPMLLPFRRLMPPRTFGGLDLSPIAVLLILQLILMWLKG